MKLFRALISPFLTHPSLRISMTIGLLLVFSWYYLSLTYQIPFDLAWDMDLLTINDVLLINSTQLPLHNDHPKFGMNLLMSQALEIGRFFDIVSVSRFSELQQSPSPLIAIAELTLFLRQTEAVIVWLTLLLTLFVFWRLFPRQHLLLILSIPLLGLQTGLLYCAMVIRTEAISIFFLLLGLALFCGLQQLKQLRFELMAWLAGGFCFGLALLTKLQAIQAAPLFLLICAYVYTQAKLPETNETSSKPQPELEKLPTQISLLILIVFGTTLLGWILLAWLAWKHPSLPGQKPVLIPLSAFASGELSFAQLLSHLKLQIVWLVLLFSPWLALLLIRLQKSKLLQRLAALYPLFWVGLFSAYLAPLVTYLFRSGISELTWSYLLQIAQSSLWTDTNASTTSSAGAFLPTLEFVLHTDTIYLLLAASTLLIGLYRLKEISDPREKSAQRLVLLIFLAGFLVMMMGSRALLRDTIWFKFLGSFSLLILLKHTCQGLHSQLMRRALIGLCILFPIAMAWSLSETQNQIKLYYAKFKFNRYTSMIDAVYTSPDMIYPTIMLSAYGKDLYPPHDKDRDILRQAIAQARQVNYLKTSANQLFVTNKPLPVRALGLAAEHFPVWKQTQDWARFYTVAPHLRGSMLISSQILTESAAHQRQNSLLPIWDPHLLLCLSESDYRRIFKLTPTEAAPIQIKHQDGIENYYPILMGLNNPESSESLQTYPYFSVLPLDWLAQFQYPPFFLVHDGNSWGPDYPNWPHMVSLIEEPSDNKTP